MTDLVCPDGVELIPEKIDGWVLEAMPLPALTTLDGVETVFPEKLHSRTNAGVQLLLDTERFVAQRRRASR